MSSRVLRSNKRRLFLLQGQGEDAPAVEPEPSKKQRNSRLRSRQIATATPDETDTGAAAPQQVSGALAMVLQQPEVLYSISTHLWVRDIKSLILTCRAWEKTWTPYLYRTVTIQQQSVWSAQKLYPQLDRFGAMVEKLHFNNYRTKIHGAVTVLRSTQCSGRLTDLHIPSFYSHSRGTYARVFGPELEWVRTLRVTLNDYDVVVQYDDLLQRVNTLPHLTSLTIEECSGDMLLPMLRFLRNNKTVTQLKIKSVRIGGYFGSRASGQRLRACQPLPTDLADLDAFTPKTTTILTAKDQGEGGVGAPQAALWQNTSIIDLSVNCELLSGNTQRFTRTVEFVHPDVRVFFGRVPNLERCQLEWTQALKLSDFKYVAKTSLANVTELKILRGYMAPMLPVLAQGCPRLKTLFIQNHQALSSPDLPGSFLAWKELETLKIDGDLVTDRQILELARSPRLRRSLKQLHLRMCRSVKGTTVRRILCQFEKLEVVQLLLMNTDITTIFETDKPWASYRTLKVLVVELFGNGPDPTFPRSDDKQFGPSDHTRFHVRRQLHALQALDLLILFGAQFSWDMLSPWPSLEDVISERDDGTEWMRRALTTENRSATIVKAKTKKSSSSSSLLSRRVTRASSSSSSSSPSSSALNVGKSAAVLPTERGMLSQEFEELSLELRNAILERGPIDSDNATHALRRFEDCIVRLLRDVSRLLGPDAEDDQRILRRSTRQLRLIEFLRLYTKYLQSDPGWQPWMTWLNDKSKSEGEETASSSSSSATSPTVAAAAASADIDVAAVSKPILVRARLLEAGALRDGAARSVVEEMKGTFDDWFEALGLEGQFIRSLGWARAIMRTRIKDHNSHLVREYSEYMTGPSRVWPMVLDPVVTAV
ncbi:hypothetical protein DFQ27_001688 [Actinomortierella ambigua]|uniref:Uncharacterized protein n=1 Tax=Actinomortierella ambigua TaxID=1343610 RepID=A0A9P6U7Y5_9FUNG|nr:hypothetical protein DFQ27_001688 [Actinomortierella ambigua]